MLTREEMVRAKASFEGYPSRHGVRIMHYHMGNGIFTQYLFKWTYKHYATISYCGVGANHQIGQVEKLIHDIQDQVRTVFLHVKQRWPEAITKHLWPYAYNVCMEIGKLRPR